MCQSTRALRLPGERSCATVERMDNYLKRRVPELCTRHKKAPAQTPRISADPSEKHHFILLPQHAWDSDIATLKTDAYRAEVNQKWDLARQLWIRINAAASGRDVEVFEAFERIARGRGTISAQPQPPNPAESKGGRSSSTTTSPSSPAQARSTPIISSPPPVDPKYRKESYRSSSSPPVPSPISPLDNDLRSEKGIDYNKLRDLLKAQKWKEADRETYEVMIRAVGKKNGQWFTPDELLNFPCTDLKTIDALWIKYSNGQFGFSVQKQIYVECGAKLDGEYPGHEIWRKFGDRVGWRRRRNWVSYDKLNPSLSSSKGTFPVWWGGCGCGWCGGFGGLGGFGGFVFLSHRGL